jgi:hypothetical protein
MRHAHASKADQPHGLLPNLKVICKNACDSPWWRRLPAMMRRSQTIEKLAIQEPVFPVANADFKGGGSGRGCGDCISGHLNKTRPWEAMIACRFCLYGLALSEGAGEYRVSSEARSKTIFTPITPPPPPRDDTEKNESFERTLRMANGIIWPGKCRGHSAEGLTSIPLWCG